MNSRKSYIDIAKGVGIILIVYGHAAAQMNNSTFYEEHLSVQSKIIFSFAIPLFFIISASFQRTQLESSEFNFKKYFKKISTRTIVPFYSLSLCFLVINLAMGNFIDSPTLSEMTISLLYQQSNSSIMPSGVLWFLFVLYIFNITTYIFTKKLNINIIHLVILSIVIRYISYNYLSSTYYFAIDKITHFFIFYTVRFYIHNLLILKPIFDWGHIFILLCLYLLTIYIIPSLEMFSPAMTYLIQANEIFGLSGIIGSFLVIGLSYKLSRSSCGKMFLSFLLTCGYGSILIYVFHMPTFTLFKMIASSINLEPGYTKQFLLFLPGVAFPLFYGKILRHNPLLSKILIGR